MDNQNQIPKTLIDELGLSDLSPEKQEQLLSKMTEVMMQRILSEVLEKLSNEDQEKYSKMIEANPTPEEMEAFLREKVTGYDEMVKRIVTDFKEEMQKEI